MLHTIGHSNLSFEAFRHRLRCFDLDAIADVRRVPMSRRHPQFARPAFETALAREGIAYRHFEELGGRRDPRPGSPHTAIAEPAFRGYADHMETTAFHTAVDSLLTWIADRRAAFLCAERDPAHCHRLLLSDGLLARGVPVVHVLDDDHSHAHAMSPVARVDGTRVVYDAGALRLF